MRGVIAAGGRATRMRPALDKTQQIVYDKPVLYYLLTNVMKAGIRDVMIVCNDTNIAAAQSLFREADWEFGVNVKFTSDSVARGPASVFLIPQVKRFTKDSPVCLMLDGIYDGGNFDEVVSAAGRVAEGATVLAARTPDPRPFGWLRTDLNQRTIDIIEKPKLIPEPRDSYLVQTHMYFYGPEVVDLAEQLNPQPNVEYGVSDLHKLFLNQGKLRIELLEDTTQRSLIWNDAGSADRLLSLAVEIQNVQRILRTLVGSPHLQALKNGWITREYLTDLCAPYAKKGIEYYDALFRIVSTWMPC